MHKSNIYNASNQLTAGAWPTRPAGISSSHSRCNSVTAGLFIITAKQRIHYF